MLDEKYPLIDFLKNGEPGGARIEFPNHMIDFGVG